MMKRLLSAFLALVLTGCLLLSVAAADVLSVGSKSDEVLSMKKRLYELGYYTSDSNLNRKYTEDTAERVRAFQSANGLTETGELSEEDSAVLFSSSAVRKPMPLPEPYKAAIPSPHIDYPERDQDGYLTEETEFVYENDADGYWTYLSHDLQVTIIRRTDYNVPLVWFETDIRVRGDQRLRAVQTVPEKPGTKYRYPYDIAADNHLVLGFSDDFFADRIKKTTGVIIREGSIIREKTFSGHNYNFPNLDMLVQYSDGRLKAMTCGSFTAQELLDQGAINVFSFGPVLISDGEMSPYLLSGHYSSKEPRQALGMIEPGHYFLASVQGRIKASAGCDLWHVAGIMLEHGVTEALNLDGGNTMALVFRGRMLNKLATWKNHTSVRTVTSLIGVGYTEEMAEK